MEEVPPSTEEVPPSTEEGCDHRTPTVQKPPACCAKPVGGVSRDSAVATGDRGYPHIVFTHEPVNGAHPPQTILERLLGTSSTEVSPTLFGRLLNTIMLDEITPLAERTVFDSTKIVNLQLPNYVSRLFEYMDLQPYHLYLAAYYLDRLLSVYRLKLCCSNTHNLTATALLVTTKFTDDEHYTNAYYSTVFGLKLEYTNELEKAFLEALDYRLWDHGVRSLTETLWLSAGTTAESYRLSIPTIR